MENQINIAKELADYAIEDGQMIRPFHNFFSELYDEIKGREFNFEQGKFTDRIDFLKHLAYCAEFAAQSTQVWKDDEPEEYQKIN